MNRRSNGEEFLVQGTDLVIAHVAAQRIGLLKGRGLCRNPTGLFRQEGQGNGEIQGRRQG